MHLTLRTVGCLTEKPIKNVQRTTTGQVRRRKPFRSRGTVLGPWLPRSCSSWALRCAVRAVSEFVVSVVSMRSVGAARGGGRRRWLVPLWGDDLDDAGSAVAGAAAADLEGEVVVPGKGDRGNLDARGRRSASPCRSFDGRRGKRRRAIGSGLQRCDIGERPVQASGKRHRLIGLSLGADSDDGATIQCRVTTSPGWRTVSMSAATQQE